jgi:outer membrane receptor protein involved in Fe transport
MGRSITRQGLRLLLASASFAALAPAAYAQDAAAPADDAVEAIVVTGSRITSNGYQAPTPVTVATATELLKSTPTSIPDGLTKLPQFIGSAGPNRQANIFGTPNHGNVLNLRGIGPTRTLILLDGVRAPPTTYLNTVDVNVFPSLLVQRVDVVTAGASSVYGSDAVSGVVNFVLDSKFTGLKGVVQGGITSRGDGENFRFGLAGGRDFLDGRAHLVASVDINVQNGYGNVDRPKLNDRGLGVGSTGVGAAGTASNPLIQVPEGRASFATFGGIATNGPFANTVFVTPGVYRPVNRGTATGTGTFFTGTSDYMAQGRYLSASALNRNGTAFVKGTYDLTPTTEVYAQFLAAKSQIASRSFSNLLFGAQAQPIFSGNPFIPAPLQAQLTATNTASFSVAKLFDDLGPIRTFETVNNYDFMTGVKGELGSRFTWKIDYAYGDSAFHFRQPGQFDLRKLAAAIDAVVDPSNGQIVCRPTLSTDAAVRALYQGCVPFNILGEGAASAQAAQYVMGTSMYDAKNTTHDVVASIAGDVFNLPAGPVNLAVGAEYRTAKLNLTSNSDPGVPVNVTGLRGLPATTVAYYLTNVAQAKGSLNVKEAFAEVAVPVLKDAGPLGSLDLNGAARRTDYSTSGGVTTWKVGGVWAPVDGLKFRATRSRDIRAPTLFDLYAGPQFTQAAVLDPHTGVSSGFNQITSGNAKLDPEIGRTFTAGFVLQPRQIPGFSLSVDYYDVQIKGAITTLTPLALLQDCEASGGTAPSCANISRPLPFSDRTPANYPTQVTVSGVNAALIQTKGIDIDASYRTTLAGGQLTARLYGTLLSTFKTQLALGQPLINYAGYNAAGSGGVTGGLPKLKGNLSINYEKGPFSIFVQENYISSLKFGPIQVYRDPKIDAFYTTDLTLTYKTKALGGRNVEFFGTVTNLFDATPPLVYPTSVPGAGLSTIVALYDVTGRAFVGGLRFAF